MASVNLEIEEQLIGSWEKLPSSIRRNLASRALNAALEGTQYPSGGEKIELAIELAEAGVDAETIRCLTHLEKEIFEGFLLKLALMVSVFGW